MLIVLSVASFSQDEKRNFIGKAFIVPPGKLPNQLLDTIRKDFNEIALKNHFNIHQDKEAFKDLSLFKEEDEYRFNYQVGQFAKREKIDFLIEVNLDGLNDKLKKLHLTIKNSETQVIYEKARSAKYQAYKEIQKDLNDWLIDFFTFIPPVGIITSNSGQSITIQITNKEDNENYIGRNFYIGPLDFTNRLGISNKYPIMGGISNQESSDVYSAQLFDAYKGKGGNQVVLVPADSSKANLGQNNAGAVSKTMFDYQDKFKKSILDCLMLPIIYQGLDPIKDVEKSILDGIKDQNICTLKNDKKLTEILLKREDTLKIDLYKTEVIKKLSEVASAGAILRTKILKIRQAYSVFFDIVSEDGENIYYSNSAILNELDKGYLTELIKSWIYDYKKSIPYSGKVVHVTNEQLLLEISEAIVTGSKQFYKIVRPVSVKFERVNSNNRVSWNFKTIGLGAFTEVKENYSRGKVFKLTGNLTVMPGDWIIIDLKNKLSEHSDEYIMSKHNIKSRRKTGKAFGSIELYNIQLESQTDTIKNLTAGIDFYLPEGWLVEVEGGRNIESSSFGIDDNIFRIAGGYSTSPRKIAWATLVDYYVGYRVQNFALGAFNEPLFGDLKYKGFFFGARIEFPIYKDLDLQLDFSLAPFDSVENSDNTLGTPSHSYQYTTQVALSYHVQPDWGFMADIYLMNFKTVYEVDDTELTLKSTMVKLGIFKSF